jgi:hypothetical protein
MHSDDALDVYTVSYQGLLACSRRNRMVGFAPSRVTPFPTLAIFSMWCPASLILVLVRRAASIRVSPLLRWSTLRGCERNGWLLDRSRVCFNPGGHRSPGLLSGGKLSVFVQPRPAIYSPPFNTFQDLFGCNIAVIAEQSGVAKDIHDLSRNLTGHISTYFLDGLRQFN